MNLKMPSALGASYKNPAQKARVFSEAWISSEGYCPSCLSPLSPFVANFKAADFECQGCGTQIQLKSTKTGFGPRLPDGAYATMLEAIRGDRSPALMLLRYDPQHWDVRDLIVIPAFALSEPAIIRRKPLAMTARRAGWVGCNIDLTRIAPDARVQMVVNGGVIAPADVATQSARLMPLRGISSRQRGWTLAVYNALQTRLNACFTTSDAYVIEHDLAAIFPDNRNGRAKIRQQLQVLRDLGLLEHRDRGEWALRQAKVQRMDPNLTN